MTLTQYQRPQCGVTNPFRRATTFNDFDQLFDHLAGTLWNPQAVAGWVPAIDVYEEKDNYVVKAEVPGLKKEDIDISLQDGVLTLSGERKEEVKDESAEVYRTERFVGRFQRTLSLPRKVNADKITATYKDGVLTVVLPIAAEAKPKQITVAD